MTIDVAREEDGRWIAEVPDIPGAMAYGATGEEAISKAKALALRAIADRLEHGEDVPELRGVFAKPMLEGEVAFELTEAHLLALGRVTFALCSLEAHLARTISEAIGAGQVVGCMATTPLSFQRLCDLLSALVRYRTKDVKSLDLLDGFIKAAAQAEARRNRLVHSYWGVTFADRRSERYKYVLKRNKGLRCQDEHVSPKDIEKVAEELDDANGKLYDLDDQLLRVDALPGRKSAPARDAGSAQP